MRISLLAFVRANLCRDGQYLGFVILSFLFSAAFEWLGASGAAPKK